MKLLSSVSAAAMLVALAAPAPAQHRAENQQAIRKVAADVADAWNRYDMTGLGFLLAADAQFVSAAGTPLKGRADIEAYHSQLRAGALRDSQLVWKPIRIHFLRPDIAVAQVATEMTNNATKEKRAGIATLTLIKQGGQWLIAAWAPSQVCP